MNMNAVSYQGTRGIGASNVSVKDIITARAIQNGYNPSCKSTDKNARNITEQMKNWANQFDKKIVSPKQIENKNKKPCMRVGVPSQKTSDNSHREVVSMVNFELVHKKSKFSFSMIASVVACAAVLAMVVYSGSLINEGSREYSELTQTLDALNEENKALALELESKNDLVLIEDIAKNDLGMIKVAEAEQKYIKLSDYNTITTYNTESGEMSLGISMLNTFGEKISNFLEYLD